MGEHPQNKERQRKGEKDRLNDRQKKERKMRKYIKEKSGNKTMYIVTSWLKEKS